MKKYRTIFISDIHLGTKGCQADTLCSFLKENTTEKLYLIGDIIDGWRLKSKVYWPQEHNNVIRRILTMAKRDTEVIYIPGNHDEFLKNYTEFNLQIGNIKLQSDDIHQTANGKQFLIIHGDEFDGITRYHKWLALLGDWGYNFLLWANRYFNFFRRKVGLGHWSLSAFLKRKVKKAVNFISNYEYAISKYCKERQFDGIICGHIHHAEIKEFENIIYINTGDWVESCTAVVEHHNGTLELIKYK